MNKFLEYLSSYQILNNLIPGIIFLVLIDMFDLIPIDKNNIVLLFFGGYFVGMILSRLGSMIIEPLFKKCKIVEYAPYSDYMEVEHKNNRLSMLLSENNMYRTFVALFLLFLLIYLLFLIPGVKLFFFTSIGTIILTILLIVLFTLSYRKNTAYFRRQIEEAKKKSEQS